MAAQLDQTDLKLLRILQGDAHLTTKELAARVNLSTSPVFERIRRLEREGFIRRYAAVLDPHHLGMRLMVFVGVKLLHLNTQLAQGFVRAVRAIPEVVECYNVSGANDYLLKVYAPSMAHYREFVLEKLGGIEGVGGIESTFVMEEVKENRGIHV